MTEPSFIDDYIDHLRYIGRRKATVDTYRGILIHMDATLPHGLLGACANDLRAWLARPAAPASRKLRRAAVRGFFAWACDPTDPLLDWDPAALLPPIQVRPDPRGPRPPATERVFALLDTAREPYYLWALLATYAGMRCCEVAACDREHVTDADTWIQGKGGRPRVVPTHPDVWAAVRGLPAGPVARRIDGDRADRRDITGRANRHFRLIGYGDIHMHALRKWYGTHARHAGDTRVAQELLGHASPATTAVYTQVLSTELRAAVNALPRRPARVTVEDGACAA